MSRRDSPSLKVRGVPTTTLGKLDALTRRTGHTRNAIARQLIEAYASGELTPKTKPSAFDPVRKNAPYPEDTAPLAISAIPMPTFSRFMERAKREGWHLPQRSASSADVQLGLFITSSWISRAEGGPLQRISRSSCDRRLNPLEL